MADHHRPTPLERAHACHILLIRFGVPAPAAADDLEEIRVAGRNAVPFLSSSGVERGVLRLIWSVADPGAYHSAWTEMLRFLAGLRLTSSLSNATPSLRERRDAHRAGAVPYHPPPRGHGPGAHAPAPPGLARRQREDEPAQGGPSADGGPHRQPAHVSGRGLSHGGLPPRDVPRASLVGFVDCRRWTGL